MTEYVHEILSFDEDGNAIVPPSRSIILRRIKRYYRSQRHQQVTKANQEKRRRKRFINRRNRLTMEKRDRAVEEARKESEHELTEEQIKEIRSKISMVDKQEIGRVPDSDDEDAKKDLELKRRMNLEKGRRVARENQQKSSRIWHAIKHMPREGRLHITDILDIARKENVPQAEQQVSGKLTPMKSSTSSSSSAILQNHQKKRRLSLQKHKPSTSAKSTGVATNTTLGHSQERQNLMVTAGAIRASTAIDLDPPDDNFISFLDNFLFEDDFTD